MTLEWMGEYRELVEALIHYCNIYAAVYKTEKMEYDGIKYSYSQIQVLEYLLESEDQRQNMSCIASRLGITRSNFSKIVSRLQKKGLVDKGSRPGSRKEILVTVLPLGRELYADYSRDILRWHFSPMFEKLASVSSADRDAFRDALFAAMGGSSYVRGIEEK